MSLSLPIRVSNSLLLAAAFLAPGAAAEDRNVPGDHDTIQEAIDVSVTGDRVLVSKHPGGPYTENLLIDVDGIQVLGKNVEINAGGAGVGITINANDVILSGFIVRNATDGGVVATGDGLIIGRLRVEGCLGNGIEVLGRDTLITRNVVQYLGGSGIVYGSPDNTGSALIERNVVLLNADSGIVSSGPDVDIVSNTVEYNQDDGIQINDGGYNGNGPGSIASNKVRFNGGSGVSILDTSADGISIEGNSIEGNGGNGLESQAGTNTVASSNKIRRNAQNGVLITSSTAGLTGNRVENNTVCGVDLNNGTGDGNHTVADNTVRGNGRDGIRVQGGNNSISDNLCDRNLGDGIDIVAATAGDSVGNDVLANACARNGHEGIDNSGTDTVISGNKCSKNGPGGFGPEIAGSGNDGIGTVAAYELNKTSDATDEDPTVEQVLDI